MLRLLGRGTTLESSIVAHRYPPLPWNLLVLPQSRASASALLRRACFNQPFQAIEVSYDEP